MNFINKTNKRLVVEPIKGTELTKPLRLMDSATSRKSNIYVLEDKDKVKMVYKLFDVVQASYAKPNSDIIKSVLGDDYLGVIEEVNLSKDERFKCLKYKYIPERKSTGLCLEDFKPIIITLDKLHSKGYVHSDVRLENMVFPETGDAKLIDFDLTDKVEPYPRRYNKFSERHDDASAGYPRNNP